MLVFTPSKMAGSQREQSGFSLLEILIAVFLLAMIGLATADMVLRANSAHRTIVKVNDVYHSARVVLDRMAREFASAYIAKPLPGPDQSRLPQTIFKAKEEFPINRVTFSSFSHIRLVRNSPESDQCVITYYGKAYKNGLYRLFRREKTVIDGEPEKGGLSLELLDNVVKLEFKYWDKQKTDWVKEWDTTKIEYRNKLPPMVEIKLVLRDKFGRDIPFVTRTRIFMKELIKR